MIALVEQALLGLGDSGPPPARPLRFLLRDGGPGPRDTSMVIVFTGTGRPFAVAKVARGACGRELLAREHDKLVRLGEVLLPRRPLGLPRPLGYFERGDAAVLVETHLPGRRLKDLDPGVIERRPEVLDLVVDWLLDYTVAIGVQSVDTGEVLLRLERTVEEYAQAFELSPLEDKLLGSLAARLRLSLGPRAPLVPAHGDFSDANVLLEGESVAVVDWDEPSGLSLPGADLFYLLGSLAATRHGLGSRSGFEKGFIEAFFAPTEASHRFRRAWNRYRSRLAIAAAAGLPLFAAAWLEHALGKLRYLEEGVGPHGTGSERVWRIAEPQSSYPVTFFAEGRCLNFTLTAELAEAFAL